MVYYVICGIVILCGVLLLVGAVLDWQWLTQREKERPKGIGHFIYEQFGAKGYRISIGVSGGLTLAAGICLLWVL